MRVLDLFAGIGGFHLACSGLGEVVLACERNGRARQTYAANFPGVPLHVDAATLDPPPHDLLCAGFPCRPFSREVRIDRRGEHPDLGAFRALLRILGEARPPLVLLENVPLFLSSPSAAELKGVLRGAGYRWTMQVRNAIEVVPQFRRRLFVTARRDGGPLPPPGPPGPGVPPLGPPVAPLLDASPPPGETEISDAEWEMWRAYRDRDDHKGRVQRHDRPMVTITARNTTRGGDVFLERRPGDVPGTMRPRMREVPKPRLFSVAEVRRLMGFPEGYDLAASGLSDSGQKRLLGNAVVPPLVARILREWLR